MIIEQLNNLPIKGFTRNIFRFSLEDLITLSGIKDVGSRKVEMIQVLSRYLMSPNNIKSIWESLPEFDQKFVQDIMINQGYLNEENLDRLARKYGRHKARVTYYDQHNTQSGYFNKDSKIALFFIDGDMPECIYNVLKEYLPETKYLFTEQVVSTGDLEGLHLFKHSEELDKDFIGITKLAGTGKLKITKASGELTKGTIKKLNEALVHKEYATLYYGLDTIKRGQDSMRLYGIYQMMLDADIIDIGDTELTLGNKANTFLAEPFSDKVKRLYEAYIGSPYINEGERIKERRFYLGYTPDMSAMRKAFVEIISKATINKWIDVEVLAEDLFRNDRLFLRQYIEYIGVTPRANAAPMNYEHKWAELERRVIDVMLIEYLHPLGMIDLAIEDDEVEKEFDYGVQDILVAKYFRINDLGAYILGIEDIYDDPTTQGKEANALWVDDKLRVIIPDSSKRYQHEIFFDRIGERVEHEQYTSYAINFQMAIRALEEDLPIDDILKYLEKQVTEPLPDILKSVFQQWQKDQHQIRIRRVAIIECDDPELTKELASLNGVAKHMIKPLAPTIEIQEGTAQKIKKELEKQNYFCTIQL